MDRGSSEGWQRKRVKETKEAGEDGRDLGIALTKIRDDDSGKGEKSKDRQRSAIRLAMPWRLLSLLLVLASIVAAALHALQPSPSAQNLTRRRRRAGMGTVVYGTARKGSDTARLVAESIRAGFRHVATSSHHVKHNESGTGEGWTVAAAELGIGREDIFLQTMFVPFGSADWAPDTGGSGGEAGGGSVEDQVQSSVRSSLANLRTDYLDAVLYHNVKNKLDPIEDVLAAWRVLERYVDDGTIRYLGVTNCHDLAYLRAMFERARVKPAIVQNRFHANRQFGVPLLPFIRERNITWQMFWTLTGNGITLRKDVTKDLARARGLTPQTFMFAFLLTLGGSPMIGTGNRQHMDEDLDVARKFDEEGIRAFFEDEEDRQKFANALGKPDLI